MIKTRGMTKREMTLEKIFGIIFVIGLLSKVLNVFKLGTYLDDFVSFAIFAIGFFVYFLLFKFFYEFNCEF